MYSINCDSAVYLDNHIYFCEGKRANKEKKKIKRRRRRKDKDAYSYVRWYWSKGRPTQQTYRARLKDT